MGYRNDYSNIKSKNHSNKFNYLRKISQILLPVCVFSVLFSQSSLVPVLVHSYDYLVSNFEFKFKLFTYTTERNCIFLLCNGILVLIIQTSGLISKITPTTKSGLKSATTDAHQSEKDDEIGRLRESEKKGIKKDEIPEEKRRETDGDFAAQLEKEEDYTSFEIEKWEEEEDDDDDDDDEGEGIDTDELKKKCEDFIKKVRQEIQGA